MIGKRWISVWVMAWALSGFLSLSVYAAPNVSVTLDKSSVSVGGTLQVRIMVDNFGSSRPSVMYPELPIIFDLLSAPESTSVQMINGAVTSQYQKRLIVRPRSTGVFSIGPFVVESDGQRVEHAAVDVTVLAPQSTPATPVSTSVSGVSQPGRAPIFLESQVSTQSVYVGEQVVLSTTLFTRYQLSQLAHEMPEIDGVWMEAIDDEPVFTRTIGGQLYRGKTVVKRALFPLKSGEVLIPASRVGYVKNFFEGQQVLETKPTVFHVKQLPTSGQPEGFQGVVGQYDWEFLTDVDALRKMTQNVPVTLRFRVSGSGYLGGLKTLTVSASDAFTIYPSKVEDSVERDGRIHWTRTFDYLVVPKATGAQVLPQFSLSYFSPLEGDYRTVSSKEIAVTVAAASSGKGGGGTSSGTDDGLGFSDATSELTFLKPVRDGYTQSYEQRLLPPLLTLLLGLTLWVGLLGMGVFRRFRLGTNRETLRSSIKQAQALVQGNVLGKEVLEALYSVMSLWVGRPVSGLPQSDIKALLLAADVSESWVNRWIVVLDQLVALGYQPDDQGRVSSELKQEIETLLEAIL